MLACAGASISKSYCLGRGAHGAVYKATLNERQCVAKVLNLVIDEGDPTNHFKKEIEAMKKIHHANIVPYLALEIDPKSGLHIIYIERYDETLNMMLSRSKKNLLSYDVQVDLCADVAQGLAYLHSKCLTHGALTSNNVLIAPDKTAKLTDYGMSNALEKAQKHPNCHMVTYPAYMPPEAFEDPPRYTTKSDCFSLGVLIIEVCTRQSPNPSHRYEEVPCDISPTGVATIPVLEKKRRESHIKNIDCNHLRKCAIECLNLKEHHRPSAQNIADKIELLKREEKYKQNKLALENNKWLIELEERTRVQGESMSRGYSTCAVTQNGEVAYFRTGATVCSYNLKTKQWRELCYCQYRYGSLAIVEGLLTSIGGKSVTDETITNKLLSLTWEDKWEELLQPMKTARSYSIAVSTDTSLAVIGGQTTTDEMKDCTDEIELMDLHTLQWSTVLKHLPFPMTAASVTVSENRVYMLGGIGREGVTKAVLTCSLKDLMSQKQDTDDAKTWSRITDIPVYRSTCATVAGQLIAIGGSVDKDLTNTDNISDQIYKYNCENQQWEEKFGDLQFSRCCCHAVTFHGAFEDLLVVAGGDHDFLKTTHYVDIAIVRK